MKSKFKAVSILFTFFTFSMLPVMANTKSNLSTQFNNFVNNLNNNENIYPIAKVDTLYPVTTIRKVTSDNNAVNLLFLGDNYSKNENKDDFANYVYDKIALPWFSTVYPKDYQSFMDQTETTRGTRIPFQTYVNDKVNIYSVQPIGNHVSNLLNNKQTFFGIYNTRNDWSSMVKFGSWGVPKNKVLLNDVSNNFLEEGAIISDRNTNTVFMGNGVGRTPCWFWTMPSTCKSVLNSVHIHEMMHSLFKLCDEYDPTMPTGVNRTLLLDTSEKNIPWKEFLNFRGIGLVSTYSSNPTRYKEYIPSNICIMKDTYNTKIDFCEVCTHEIITSTAKFTQNELFYIADPQLTYSEGRPNYKENFYGTQYLQSLELYDFNIDQGSNKHLDFRTVVDNITTQPRNVKLKVTITGDNGFTEESQTFNIQPGEIKQLKLITTNQAGELNKNKNTIIGEVIDADTNKVLATSYDRLNYYYLNQQYMPYDSVNFGKKLHKVTINFKDSKTNQPLPNIKPSVLIKRDGETFQLQKILFNGYQLDQNKSNIDNTLISVNGKDLSFTYYYDSLPYKSLKLKLVDENNSLVQEKIVKVYDGQKFIPRSSDFFLYDLESYYGDNNEQNKNWIYSVEPPNQIISYHEITDNQSELTYKKIKEIPSYFNAMDRRIIQDKDINFFETLNDNFYSNFYNNKYEIVSGIQKIIYNSIDLSSPNKYKVTFADCSDSKKISKRYKTISVEVVPNSNTDRIPTSIDSELKRINSYEYLYMPTFENKDASMNDFESINQNNLLSNINNFNLNKEKFDYEVVNFQKLYPSGSEVIFLTYKFKIKITDKVSRASTVTNEFNKYIELKDDETITPPTNEVELQNEINRINSLNLTLKNSTLTQEEVNNINQSNILQNINGWVETTGFLYEVINFNNLNNQFKFQIKVSKDGSNKTSKEFILSYQIQNPGQTEEELLQQEINRINNLSLSLISNTFTQDEIDKITTSNFSSKLSNWSSVILNSNKYNYAIATLNKENNKFIFTIKVTLKSNSNISKTSNNFELSYQISQNVNQDLLNEKNRIDKLDLRLNKLEFTKNEIEEIIKNPNSITKYLNNWSPQNQFNYEFIINNSSDKNQLSLTIKITNQANANTEYQTSKEFVLPYQISSSDNITNDNSSNSNNLTTIVLASTLVPAGAIGAGVAGTIIYKKKRRKY